ncbi:transposase [Roseibium sp. TrichSKD4]|nr:transposase [Roseibium sp. TrichSKD4]
MLRAVDKALEAGVPTKTHILNLLHRLIDRKPTEHPEVDPRTLGMQTTPEANLNRYDGVRQAGEKRHAS